MGAMQGGDAASQYLLGQGGGQEITQAIDQARQQLAQLPAGPARDKLAAQIQQMQTTGKLGLQQQGTNLARQGLTGLLGGEQYWGGQLPLSYSQLGEQAREANLQNALGWGGLDVQSALGWGNIGLGQQQQNLAQQQFADVTGAGRDWQTQQAALDRAAQQQLAKSQQPSTFQKIMGGIGGVLGGLGSVISPIHISDMRVKENIEPGGRGLSALKALPSYTYNYKWSPEPQQGIMAQDLEKVAPELVHERAGIKMVDTYGLLSMTMNAVKELDKKLAAKKGRK
jgi:hypothetical protein